MGFSSFKCSKSKLSIPSYPYAELPIEASNVVMILPDDNQIQGIYDGYGRIGVINIYELLEQFLPESLQGNGKEIYFNGELVGFTSVGMYDHKFKGEYVPEGSKFLTCADMLRTMDISLETYRKHWEVVEGKSMNELKKLGYVFKSGFNQMMKLLKVVRSDQYQGETFQDLETSESCKNQGFFYGADIRETIKKSLV